MTRRPNNISRRGFLQNVLGIMATVSLPTLWVPPKPVLLEFYAYQTVGIAIGHPGVADLYEHLQGVFDEPLQLDDPANPMTEYSLVNNWRV